MFLLSIRFGLFLFLSFFCSGFDCGQISIGAPRLLRCVRTAELVDVQRLGNLPQHTVDDFAYILQHVGRFVPQLADAVRPNADH
eukprot:SAG25_NODE_5930_length_604_cov_1.166337_3_plen_84_part_00